MGDFTNLSYMHLLVKPFVPRLLTGMILFFTAGRFKYVVSTTNIYSPGTKTKRVALCEGCYFPPKFSFPSTHTVLDTLK